MQRLPVFGNRPLHLLAQRLGARFVLPGLFALLCRRVFHITKRLLNALFFRLRLVLFLHKAQKLFFRFLGPLVHLLFALHGLLANGFHPGNARFPFARVVHRVHQFLLLPIQLVFQRLRRFGCLFRLLFIRLCLLS